MSSIGAAIVLETAAETPPIKNSIKNVLTSFFFYVGALTATGAGGATVVADGAGGVTVVGVVAVVGGVVG